eukprot:6572584-Heterocapsa_arctica.AAC.1
MGQRQTLNWICCLGQFEICIHTRDHEWPHVVDHVSHGFTIYCGVDWDVLATQALIYRARLVSLDGFSYQCPSLYHIETGTRQFKVVHIHHKQKLKFRVPIDTRPVGDGGKTALDQGQLEIYHWLSETFEGSRPALLRERYP